MVAVAQWILALVLVGVSCLASDQRQPANTPTFPNPDAVNPDEVQVAIDAHDASMAAAQAKHAATQAEKVAAHSVHIAHGAHRALKRARNALRAVRAAALTTTPPPVQTVPRISSVGNGLAAMVAEHPVIVASANSTNYPLENMQEELRQLRGQLDQCKESAFGKGGRDKSINQMDQELSELQEMLRNFEVEEARTGKHGAHDILKGEIEHLKDAVARLEKFGKVQVSLPPVDPGAHRGELRYRIPGRHVTTKPRVQLTPLADLSVRQPIVSYYAEAPQTAVLQPRPRVAPQVAFPCDGAAQVPCGGGLDIDTEMPYGELEPFGREDTAQELTEASIRESDAMVDQLERAEVAEEKRATFRALTRLRGAAITSFDGVARSQTGNIDEYDKVHKWRVTHPLNHLADEESDVSKWAFPEDADF